MKIKNQLTIQRLVGKIDNDFNISESDWIPRVAAWTIDALAQMKILPFEKKRRKLEVSDRVAIYPCDINGKEFKVFDKNCREIPNFNAAKDCCNSGFDGKKSNSEIAVFDSSNKTGINPMQIATVVNTTNRNFVLKGNKIYLNFDTDFIITESLEIATYHDEYYDCECPYIYDDGLLLEALAWYCLFKYLSRGSSHPVYSLKSPSPVTNPWTQWNTLRPKAAASVKIAIGNSGEGWNNFFYNSTFLPRS